MRYQGSKFAANMTGSSISVSSRDSHIKPLHLPQSTVERKGEQLGFVLFLYPTSHSFKSTPQGINCCAFPGDVI